MSRPRKGVGEHRLLKKGPLLVTTALLSFYPVCVAEAATSSFEKRSASSLSGAYTHSKNHQSQTTLLDRLQNQPRNYQDPRLLSLVPLSIETLDNLKSTLSNYQNQLNTLKNSAPKDPKNAKDYALAITDVENRISDLKTRISALESGLKSIQEAQNTLQNAISRLQASQTALTTSTAQKLQAIDAYNIAKSNLDVAQNNLDSSMALKTQADAALTQQNVTTSQSLTILNEHRALKTLAQSNLQAAQDALHDAQQAQQQAQTNYDTNLIPDPDWTPPTYQKENTRLVPYTDIQIIRTLVPTTTTTFQEQVIPNLLPDPTLTSTEGWSGVYPGWQGSQPGMYDGEITFSYMYQTVTQGLYSGPFENATLTLSADWYSDWTADSYSMTVTAEDINRNPVGTATYTNTRTGHDWTNRSVTLTATGPVSYITISFSGIDHGYWYGMYGPRIKNPALEVSYGQYVTETTYEEVITYEEVTKYREEIYYTTEILQPQQGLTVRVYNQLPAANPQRSDTAYNLCKTTTLTSINHQWSGGDILGCGSDRVMIHYTGYITPTETITSLQNTADDGFYMDINGVNAINNWTLKGCSGNWNPVNLQAGQSYAIDAWFYEWGGGACSILNYQSVTSSGVVPEAWYSNGASAPLIKDPALLIPLQEANANLVEAENQASSAAQTLNEATSEVTAAEEYYNSQLGKSQEAQTSYEQASLKVEEDRNILLSSTSIHDLSLTDVDAKTSAELGASAELTLATQNKEEIENSLSKLQTSNEASLNLAEDASSRIPSALEDAIQLQTKEPEPLPEPEPEPEGSVEIPKDLSADNLMDVDLEAVDPTELTSEQAEQLVEAALETFETAVEGSAEYEQALDALALAAQEDDIVLDESIAAIPGVGQAAAAVVAVFNIVGNVGADISPKVRKKAQEVVVTTLVVGQIAQNAAMAATASAAFRRRN